MDKTAELKAKIEVLRNQLNQSVIKDEFETYYAKSVEMDQLIAEYIEKEESIPA